MESLLGDHMRFRQTADGKTVFLSIDRVIGSYLLDKQGEHDIKTLDALFLSELRGI